MNEEVKNTLIPANGYKRDYFCYFCQRGVTKLPTSRQVIELLTEINRIYFCTNAACPVFGLLTVGVRFVDKKIEIPDNKNILQKNGGDKNMDDTPIVPGDNGEPEVPATPAEQPAEPEVPAAEVPAEGAEAPGEPETPAEPTTPASGEETPGQEPAVEKIEVPVTDVSQAQNAGEQAA